MRQHGRLGIIVETDESKFGKVKYHRGHRVEGIWVVGGIEHTDERKCFLTTVPNRNAQTMRAIITRYVRPGKIIHMDCRRAYDGIPEWEMDYSHCTVNQYRQFITEDGVHTNRIEGKMIQRNCTTDIFIYLYIRNLERHQDQDLSQNAI